MTRREIIIVAVAFIVIAVLVYPGAAFDSGYYANGEDLTYHAATRSLVRDSYRSFSLPLWNPYSGCGEPLAANVQAGAYYPPNILFSALPAGIAFNWLLILHTALAGWGMWLLLRSYGLGRHASAFGALTFMLSGFLTSHRGHVAMHASAAWAPLVVFLWLQVRQRHGLRFNVGFAAAAAMQMLAGHPQVVFMTAVLLIGRELYGAISERQSRFRMLVLLYAGALLLSAVQMLPALVLAFRSGRTGVHSGSFFSDAVTLRAFLTFIMPYIDGAMREGFYGPAAPAMPHLAEITCYIGILPLIFFARAVVFGFQDKKPRPAVFWVLVVFFGLILLPGKYSPFGWLMYYLPVAGWFRVPGRWLFLVHFAIAVSAAIAFEKYYRTGRSRISETLIALCGIWVLILPVFSEKMRVPRVVVPAIMIFLGTSYVVMAGRMRHAHFRWVAVVIVLADLFFFAHFFDLPENVPVERLSRTENYVAKLIPEEGLLPTRVFPVAPPRGRAAVDSLSANVNAACGLSSPLWMGPFGSPYAKGVLAAHGGGTSHRTGALLKNQKILSMLGVRYVVATPDNFEMVERCNGFAPPLEIPLVRNESDTTETRGVEEKSDGTVNYLARRAVTRWGVKVRPGSLYELSFEAKYIEEPGGYLRCGLYGEGYGPPGETWKIGARELTSEFHPMKHTFHVRSNAPATLTLQIRSEGRKTVALRKIRLREYRTGFGPGYTPFAESPGRAFVYKNHAALPRVFCVKRVRSLRSADLLRDALWSSDFNPAGEALVENQPDLEKEEEYANGKVEIKRRSASEVRLEASGDDTMFCVLAESFWPGWRCWIDGNETKIYRVNGMLRAVVVPAGRHEIFFEYRPIDCYAGWALTILACIVLIVGRCLYLRWADAWPHLFKSVERPTSNVERQKEQIFFNDV